MDSIDVELFIDEVRRRPSLWDPFSEAYKNRQLRKDDWSEVCATFCQDYWNKDENERVQIGRCIQMKWRNIRDSYIRHNRLVKRKRSKGVSKFFRSYVHAKHLAFLNNVIESHQADISLISEHNTEDITEENTSDDTIDDTPDNTQHNTAEGNEQEYRDRHTPSSTASNKFIKKEKRFEDHLINYMNAEQKKIDEERDHVPKNDDMAFFTSLLPTLQTLRPQQKLLFRIDVMKLLVTYNEPPQ